MPRRKRSGRQDDVLSLTDDSSLSQSSDSNEAASPKRPPIRSIIRVPPRNEKDRGSTNATRDLSKDGGNVVDLDKLTPDTVERLKAALGLQNVQQDMQTCSGRFSPLSNELFESNDENVETEVTPTNVGGDFSNELANSLFLENKENANESQLDDDIWPQAKLKAPDRGDPIAESLAKLINDSCTNLCSVNDTIAKYKVPSNCEFMLAPKVNEEIWGDLARHRRVQTTDRLLRDTQNLVSAGMIPILSMANLIKPFIGQIPEVKTLIADSLTLLGQVQFNLSVRRRYLLRPFLKQKYSGICNINTPITSFLFGDDVNKELKKCETSIRVGKFNDRTTSLGPIRGRRCRARGRPTSYGGYGRGGYSKNRQAVVGSDSSYGQFGYKHDIPRQRKSTPSVPSATVNTQN